MKDSFVFRKEWRDAVSGMSADVRLEFYEAVIEYATTGNIPQLKQLAGLAFKFAKEDLDKDAKKYEMICERNRNNGKNGGRPKNPVGFSKTQHNPNNPVGFLETQHNPDVCLGFLGKEKKIEKEISPTPPYKEKEIEEKKMTLSRDENFVENFFSNQTSIEQLLMQFGMKPNDKDELRKMADGILSEWAVTEEVHLNYNEFAKHLLNTLRIKVREKEKGVNPKQEELRKTAEEREQEHENFMKKWDEMRKNAVSREDAMKSAEYWAGFNSVGGA